MSSNEEFRRVGSMTLRPTNELNSAEFKMGYYKLGGGINKETNSITLGKSGFIIDLYTGVNIIYTRNQNVFVPPEGIKWQKNKYGVYIANLNTSELPPSGPQPKFIIEALLLLVGLLSLPTVAGVAFAVGVGVAVTSELLVPAIQKLVEKQNSQGWKEVAVIKIFDK